MDALTTTIYRRAMAPADTTLGSLLATGYAPRSVKEEIRANLLARLAARETSLPGIVGFDDTVLPEVERALLAGHDIVLLGERGQGKTRLIRTLVSLLDPWIPVVAGCEVNDEPTAPICARCQRLAADLGDALPVTWLARDERLGEKLATPDTSVGDLIGDVDPVKVAEGRSLGDAETIHYGLVPRTNRGIMAINELPDLAERIQVALLNVLEERDIQVRGYRLRLPLDLLVVASANPEDYTNRGRIITPLKDRFGSQIRTHYPLEAATEVSIIRQEARPPSVGSITVTVPPYMETVVASFSQLARSSSQVNQRSGVSVRLSVSNYEVMAANALRRGLRLGETNVVPRVCDLDAFAASTGGKIEIEAMEDGREGAILRDLVKAAVLTTYRDVVSPELTRDIVTAFEEGAVVHTGEDVPSIDQAALVDQIPALKAAVTPLLAGDESPANVAAAVEFVLEGMHLSKRLNKDQSSGSGGTYRSR